MGKYQDRGGEGYRSRRLCHPRGYPNDPPCSFYEFFLLLSLSLTRSLILARFCLSSFFLFVAPTLWAFAFLRRHPRPFAVDRSFFVCRFSCPFSLPLSLFTIPSRRPRRGAFALSSSGVPSRRLHSSLFSRLVALPPFLVASLSLFLL